MFEEKGTSFEGGGGGGVQGGGSTEKTRMELWYSNVMSEIRVIVYR